jgi:hypothetical protein
MATRKRSPRLSRRKARSAVAKVRRDMAEELANFVFRGIRASDTASGRGEIAFRIPISTSRKRTKLRRAARKRR